MLGRELLRAATVRREGDRAIGGTAGLEEGAALVLRPGLLYLSRCLDRSGCLDRPWLLYRAGLLDIPLCFGVGNRSPGHHEREAEEDHQDNDGHRRG